MGQELKVTYKKNMKDFGYFYGDDYLIEIKDDKNWRKHLFHELCHAVFFYSGHSEKLGTEYEEALVRALENGFSSLVAIP